MRRTMIALAALSLLGSAACGPQESAAGKVGVILPDTASSQRWEREDPKFLAAAFEKAGVDAEIQNAHGDKSEFLTIADNMISRRVAVLMIVNLDSGTGKAVLEKAKAAGIATIDYDRLTLDGGANYYVSFDNVAVGRLQGEGLVKCLTDLGASKPVVAELNGSPTDNNATEFKQGYDSVLKARFDSGEFVKGPDDSVPAWDNARAATIFEQQLTKHKDIGGVLAANDGLANAAISILKRQGLAGRIPVTGQDATVQGLQNILDGSQCMTVYKAIEREAEAAAELAISLARGAGKETTQSVPDPGSGRDVPAVLLAPRAVYRDNIGDVVKDGYVTEDELCTDGYAELCARYGVS